jgi:hypothetical protein
MHDRLKAVAHRVGRRGASLLFFGTLDAVMAFSLFSPPPSARRSTTAAFVEYSAPLWVWGLLWGLAGVACFVSAFLRNDRWGFTCAIGIKVLWGSLYVYGWILGVERAYLASAIWLCMAGYVAIISTWPEAFDSSDPEAEA